MASDPEHDYVSRGGLKLAAALDAFALDVSAFTCVDLGCNVGGFTDCLLQRGANKVFAVDSGYGALAWKLRQDARVVVMERTNALHCDPPPPEEEIDLAVIDLGWTRQKHAIPAALKWRPAKIVTLIKPHYEAESKHKGVLSDELAAEVTQRVVAELPSLGVTVDGLIQSPIRGGAGKGKAGNIEYLALLTVR